MTVPEAPEGGPGEEVGAPPESTERSAKLEEDIPVWGKELWAEDDLRWDFIHFQRLSKTFEDFHSTFLMSVMSRRSLICSPPTNS